MDVMGMERMDRESFDGMSKGRMCGMSREKMH